MKRIYLVRHAKATKSDGTIRDFDRELNPRGIRDAAFMSELLVKQFGKVSFVVCSPSARTMATAQIFAKASGLSLPKIITDPGIYDSTPENLLAIITSYPQSRNHILMVGHNPGFSLVASYLSGNVIEMPTSAFVALDLDIDKWEELHKGCGNTLAFEYPSKHFDL